MTYIEGFIVPVPEDKKDAYFKMASDGAPLFREFGVERHVEAWDSDIPDGKVTDFRKAVDAKDGERVVFSWFEYPDRATRDTANEKIRTDERMAALGQDMPFDGQRMVMGGFETIVDEGDGRRGGYTDGFVLPVPNAKREEYRALAQKMSKSFLDLGAVRVLEAVGDDVQRGKVTDFYRSVKAEEDENVVFSFIEWPDKATRDDAWKKMMENDPAPDDPMPFDGKRMFWGGFDPLFDESGVEK